jgi:hypothetical protein
MMDLEMGSHTFDDVTIPVLWGTRALLQDKEGRMSVVDLAGSAARLEVLAGGPAPDVRYTPTFDGFTILSDDGLELYTCAPTEGRITGLAVALPEIEITSHQIRVGTNTFSNSSVSGYGVGIAVTEDGIALGAPLPPDLARLAVP